MTEVTPDDWRLRGQEDFLQGATLVRKRYRATETNDHDHCEFCWRKFMDPGFSAAHAQSIAADPWILIEGYAVIGRAPEGSRTEFYWWVCPTCVQDFQAKFGWKVLEHDGSSG